MNRGLGPVDPLAVVYFAYALLDAILDHYFLVLERVGEQVETLEDEIIAHPDADTQCKIRDLREILVRVRRAGWPLRELFSGMPRPPLDARDPLS